MSWEWDPQDDVLFMGDPVLSYINGILMQDEEEEETEESRRTLIEAEHRIRYQAIMDSLYEVIGAAQQADAEKGDASLTNVQDHERGGSPNINITSCSFFEDRQDDRDLERPADQSPAFYEEGEVSFVGNTDLAAEEECKKFYKEWRSQPTKSEMPILKRKRRNIHMGAARQECHTDLAELLLSCAHAVSSGHMSKACEILQEMLAQGASPCGSGLQRVAHCFGEALTARMCGLGGGLFRMMASNRPSSARMLKAFKLVFQVCPYVRLSHYFANQSIIKVAAGAQCLHIIDYGILYGFQWPCLISALADRKGGPPLLRITGIEFPQHGPNPAAKLEEVGRRLLEYATACKVPFEYHGIPASRWEELQPASLHLRAPGEEVLVVNCMKRLRHIPDESMVDVDPREKLLMRMRMLQPELLVTAVVHACHNAPFFLPRFKEALHYYTRKFDMLDTTVPADSLERLLIEREWLGKDILNIVACEGPERLERPQPYKQWQAKIQQAGFLQLPIPAILLSRSTQIAHEFYHKEFNVHHDSNKWLLVGWKGRTLEAYSTWRSVA